MVAMAEVSQQQILDLLYEIHDGTDRIDAKLDENIVLLRIINYEMELCLQRIAAGRSRYSEKA